MRRIITNLRQCMGSITNRLAYLLNVVHAFTPFIRLYSCSGGLVSSSCSISRPAGSQAWLLHLQRLPANVVLSRGSVLPDLLHAPLALFPYIRRGRVRGVELADDGAAAVSCSGLASQREVRRAVLIGIHAQRPLLAADGFQQSHKQPPLLLGQMVAGNGLECLNGGSHAALAFWLVVGSGSVLHVACGGFEYVVGGGHFSRSLYAAIQAPMPKARPSASAIHSPSWVSAVLPRTNSRIMQM